MNKQIIFLTSFILCSLTTHSNFGVATGETQIMIKSRTRAAIVSVKYNINDRTCTLNDIKKAASMRFKLKPNTFDIIYAGKKLPENVKFPIKEFTEATNLHLVRKKN